MSWLRAKRWSPYAVGALIGVLSWFSFLVAQKPLGVSTAFVRTAGLVEKAVAPEHVAENAYFQSKTPRVDFGVMLVVGILAGAYVSARLSGTYQVERVPELWARRFGPAVWKRYAGAFLGGLILVFGARLAGGCTSGHAISGGLQLAVSGWLFIAAVFAAGIATALALFGREVSHV